MTSNLLIFLAVIISAIFCSTYFIYLAIKKYGIEKYPFSINILESNDIPIIKKIKKNGDKFIFLFSLIIVNSLIFIGRDITRNICLSFMSFLTLCPLIIFISDFVIYCIKVYRYILLYFQYKKTKQVNKISFFKLKNGVWQPTFFVPSFYNINYFLASVSCFLSAIFLLFNIFMILVCFKLHHNFTTPYILYGFLPLIICGFLIGVAFIIKRFVIKLQGDSFLQSITFYPSGNINTITIFKNYYIH